MCILIGNPCEPEASRLFAAIQSHYSVAVIITFILEIMSYKTGKQNTQ